MMMIGQIYSRKSGCGFLASLSDVAACEWCPPLSSAAPLARRAPVACPWPRGNRAWQDTSAGAPARSSSRGVAGCTLVK